MCVCDSSVVRFPSKTQNLNGKRTIGLDSPNRLLRFRGKDIILSPCHSVSRTTNFLVNANLYSYHCISFVKIRSSRSCPARGFETRIILFENEERENFVIKDRSLSNPDVTILFNDGCNSAFERFPSNRTNQDFDRCANDAAARNHVSIQSSHPQHKLLLSHFFLNLLSM